MAQTVAERDLGDLIMSLQRRIRALEQRSTTVALIPSATLPTDPSFHTIDLDGELISIDSDPATGLGATPGVFLDNIFLDIAWTGSSTANEYQVELAEKISGVYQAPTQYRTGGTSIRIEHLAPDTTYGVRVYALNNLGLASSAEPSVGFNDYTTGHDSTTPSALTGFTVTAGFRSLVAVWANTADFDFDYYDLQLATNSGFTTGVRNTVVRGSIGGFTDLVANTTYWLRARTVDQSGNPGPWTAGASVTTQQLVGGDVPPLYIDTAVIANGAILEAKIGNLEVTNAKIKDAAIDKLITGTFTTDDFILGTGGQIKTAAVAPGFVLNNQGFSLYDGSAVRTVFLDAATGTATFTGTVQGSIITGSAISGGTIIGSTIKTAATGKRIELNNSLINRVQFYSGDASEVTPGYLQIDVVGGGGQVIVASPAMNPNPGNISELNLSSGGTAGQPAQLSLSASGVASLSMYEDFDGLGGAFFSAHLTGDEYLKLKAGSASHGDAMSLPSYGRVRLEADTDFSIFAGGDVELFAYDLGYGAGAEMRLYGSDRIYMNATLLQADLTDAVFTLSDDLAITASGVGSVIAITSPVSVLTGSSYLKLTDGTAPAYNGDLDLAFSGPIYATTPEIAIFGGKLTIYDTGHGIHINGTNASTDNLSGGWGGAGGGINGRSGHTFSFEWDGTYVKIYVDSTLVRTI